MPSLLSREYQPARIGMARGVSSLISVVLQVALGVTVVSMSAVTMTMPDVASARLRPPRLVSAVFLPAAVIETPLPDPPETKTSEEVKAPTPAPERPALVAVREFENKAVPTPTANEVRPVEVPPTPTPAPVAPLPPPKPAPSVGTFPTTTALAKTAEPARHVESAGFNAPVARSSQSRLGQATVGAFDAAERPGSRQQGSSVAAGNIVADSGFSQPSAAAPSSQQSRVVRDGGFGTANSREQPRAQQPSAGPSTAGFSDARIVEQTRKAEAVTKAPPVVAVEVLSKPTPVYTDEARRLKIEGEVVLEVDFSAAGTVRVVRVVRGLGHGLDESAAQAAQQIRFKPATSEGRPIDYRTTVQIVFRLA